MITLYHGSNVRIDDIDLSRCNPYKGRLQDQILS